MCVCVCVREREREREIERERMCVVLVHSQYKQVKVTRLGPKVLMAAFPKSNVLG